MPYYELQGKIVQWHTFSFLLPLFSLVALPKFVVACFSSAIEYSIGPHLPIYSITLEEVEKNPLVFDGIFAGYLSPNAQNIPSFLHAASKFLLQFGVKGLPLETCVGEIPFKSN